MSPRFLSRFRLQGPELLGSPVTDVKSFAALSHVFETVGTSAYNGAAAFIQNKVTLLPISRRKSLNVHQAYLTVAASILGVETRQAAWIGSAVLKSNPWNTAFEVRSTYVTVLVSSHSLIKTPLDFNQVHTLASPFIASCPESNPSLAAKSFAPLSAALLDSGSQARLTFAAPTDTSKEHGKPLYAAFLIGTGTIFVPVNMTSNEVEVPKGLIGFVFVVLTSDGGRVSDETTLAGPAILQFPFDSHGTRFNSSGPSGWSISHLSFLISYVM